MARRSSCLFLESEGGCLRLTLLLFSFKRPGRPRSRGRSQWPIIAVRSRCDVDQLRWGFQDRDPVPLAFTDNARLAPTDFDSGSRIRFSCYTQPSGDDVQDFISIWMNFTVVRWKLVGGQG